MSESIEFEYALEDDDWGLIISSDGSLKGLFIPEGKEEEDVPPYIVKMCQRVFGIDVTSNSNEYATLH